MRLCVQKLCGVPTKLRHATAIRATAGVRVAADTRILAAGEAGGGQHLQRQYGTHLVPP